MKIPRVFSQTHFLMNDLINLYANSAQYGFSKIFKIGIFKQESWGLIIIIQIQWNSFTQ